jgi:hypothetical protein
MALRGALWYAVGRVVRGAGLLCCCGVRDIRHWGALDGAGRPMFVSETNTY